MRDKFFSYRILKNKHRKEDDGKFPFAEQHSNNFLRKTIQWMLKLAGWAQIPIWKG